MIKFKYGIFENTRLLIIDLYNSTTVIVKNLKPWIQILKPEHKKLHPVRSPKAKLYFRMMPGNLLLLRSRLVTPSWSIFLTSILP